VMTGWRALMGIPNGRGFSPNAKGFSLNSVHGSRIRIFCGFYAKGQEFVRIQLEEKFPNAFKTMKVRTHKSKEIITRQMQKIKFHILLPKFQTSLVQTSQKACSAQTGDE
jgi:hypothetical protein